MPILNMIFNRNEFKPKGKETEYGYEGIIPGENLKILFSCEEEYLEYIGVKQKVL